MGIVSHIASFGMAVGPPLVYSDQYISVIRRRDSTGFSKDVCGVLIFANVTRIFFWYSARFEVALLVQSILMIIAQIALLYVVVKYAVREDDAGPHQAVAEQPGKSAEQRLLAQMQATGPIIKRPFLFWQWPSFGTYIEAVAAYIAVLGIIVLCLHSFQVFVDAVGFFALGLESTLPIPQLITNFRRRSLAGFRLTVLLGWLGGDAFKTIYFFLRDDNGLQFRACAVFQLSVDCLIVVQAWLYRHNTRLESLALNDDQEDAAYRAALHGEASEAPSA